MTKHGVLMSGHSAVELFSVGVMEGNLLFHTPVVGNITLQKLCDVAVEQKLTHLWVLQHEDIYNDRNTAFLDASDIDWNLKLTWELKGQVVEGFTDHLRSVYGWARSGENRDGFNIIFLGPWCAWQWGRKADITPKQVLWMVGNLERELGIPITGSPGNTGKKYLESLHPRHKEWFNPPGQDLTELPFNQAAKSLNWTRVPTEAELSRKYLVKIDKNSAFPRASVEYKYGVESVCHYQEGDALSDATKVVGIWRVAHDANGFGLTPPTVTTPWITTPILKRLYQMGCYVRILEGWYFPESNYVFKQWAENLWMMRTKYQDSRRGAFKQVLNDTFGLYRSPQLESKDTEKPQVFRRRPDWYAQTVGGTCAIMLQNIDSFAKKFLLYPVGTAIDCILYCSDKPLNELLPDNKETLGAYKHVWQLEMTDEVRDILKMGSNVNKKLMLLNRLAGEYEE